MLVLFLFLFLASAGSAVAEAYWPYKDWMVQVEAVDTGQDLRLTCSARTGGDGLPALGLAVSNGDAGPPHLYPVPQFREFAPRGMATQIAADDVIIFEFDDGTGAEVELVTGIAEGAFAFARATPFPRDVLWMLQSMRTAQVLTVYRSNGDVSREMVFEASLSGFTAAYLKMMTECGFDAGAVLD